MNRPGLRRVVAGAGAVLVLALAAGCGQPTVEDYCDRLRADQERLGEIVASGDPARLLGGLELFRGLREEAPRDLRDEWDTFIGALQGLQDALDAADVRASAFDGGTPPDGLSEAERARIVRAAERVQADDVVAASSGIETQARDVCRLNLGL